MKIITACTATAAALAASAVAQDITSLPQCAQQPILEGISASGCPLTDIACICANQAFIDGLVQQIPAVCTPADIPPVIEFAQVLCAAYGVEVNLPASLLPDSSTSPATTTSTGSSSAIPTETVAATSSSAVETSATASATGIATTTAAATTTSAAAETTVAAETTDSPSSTETPSPSSTETENGAVTNSIDIPVLMAIAAGLVAAL